MRSFSQLLFFFFAKQVIVVVTELWIPMPCKMFFFLVYAANVCGINRQVFFKLLAVYKNKTIQQLVILGFMFQ